MKKKVLKITFALAVISGVAALVATIVSGSKRKHRDSTVDDLPVPDCDCCNRYGDACYTCSTLEKEGEAIPASKGEHFAEDGSAGGGE